MPKWIDFLVKPTKFSNYNLSTTRRGSISPGMLVPVWYKLMNPGETFRMNIRSLIRTNPVQSPLMGRFKVRVVTAVSNFKNYSVGLEGYRRSFDWRTFCLPHLRFKITDNVKFGERSGVSPTSLMDYLGYDAGWYPNVYQYPNYETDGSGNKFIRKSAIPFLVYYDFYRNYLVNPQDGYFPYFNLGEEPSESVSMVQISQLDEIYEDIHKAYDGSYDESITSVMANGARVLFTDLENCKFSNYHVGLVGTMFDPDINTTWLSTNNFARLQAVKVNTQGTSASEGGIYTNFEDIVKASSLWDFISREIYGGGTYADHIYSQFGVSVKSDMNIPQIVHIYDSVVDFEDITSQSATEEAVVGEQFGVGRGYGQSSRFTIRNIDNNYAMAMTFMWITPLVDYATGIPDEMNLLKFSDLYSPSFDNYSMQPRFLEQVSATPNIDWTEETISSENTPLDKVIGYQPAWSEYKTDVNRVFGLFKRELSYWAIIRSVSYLTNNINGFTKFPTYVYQTPIGCSNEILDAIQYEVPFNVTNEDNFFYQLRFDIVASRPMSKSVIPHVK